MRDVTAGQALTKRTPGGKEIGLADNLTLSWMGIRTGAASYGKKEIS